MRNSISARQGKNKKKPRAKQIFFKYATNCYLCQVMKDFWPNALFALMRGLSFFPLRLHYCCARFTAWIIGNVVGYRKEVIDANLRAAMPCLGDGERRRLEKDYYRYIADLVAEFVWCVGKSGDRLSRKGFVRVENPEILKKLHSKGHGVMVLCSHSGNWEMLPAAVDLYTASGEFVKSDFATTYKRLRNDFWEAVTIKARTYGKCSPSQFIDSRGILRYMVKHRDEGKIYHFLVDQYPYGTATPYYIGEFFGLPTDAIMGAANLAERFAMPVVYLHNFRKSRGQYVMVPEEICGDASVMGAEAVMKRYFEMLEADVKQYPCNWLWSHKRWKNIAGLYPPRKKKN